MEKENARKQTLEQLHERRKQVVRLHKKGIKIMQIVEMTGLSYPPVPDGHPNSPAYGHLKLPHLN